MNEYEKEKLREHWQKPGKLKSLLQVLPLTPEGRADGMVYKKVVWMTGIGFDLKEMGQVYYMLEEDGVLVRESEGHVVTHPECTHPGSLQPCHLCQHRNRIRDLAAGVHYKLAKPLAEY